jgi:hypothetical protein
MNSVMADFQERSDSVKSLLSHIESVSSINGNVDITIILKSGFYVALYNNIEATIYSILERVHEECNKCHFVDLSPKIKDKFLHYHFGNGDLNIKRKRKLAEDFASSNLTFPYLSEYQKVKTVFSGNLDCFKIREVFKSYGIIVGNVKGNAEHILLVKNKRNKIAHGEQSLSEAGLQVTNKKLGEVQKSVNEALFDFISYADLFLNQRQFLAQT